MRRRELSLALTVGTITEPQSAVMRRNDLGLGDPGAGRAHRRVGVRAAIPRTDPLAKAEFTTIRERLIKIGARVIEHIAHPHPIADQLSGGSAVPRRRVRPDALGTLSHWARGPGAPGRSTPNALHTESHHTDPTRPVDSARACRIHVQNKPKSCIIRASSPPTK
jgi:hypothetical protein